MEVEGVGGDDGPVSVTELIAAGQFDEAESLHLHGQRRAQARHPRGRTRGRTRVAGTEGAHEQGATHDGQVDEPIFLVNQPPIPL